MLVYGKNTAKEILKKPEIIKKIILQDNFDDKNIISLITKLNIQPSYKPKREINLIANGNNQGIIIDIEEFQYVNINEIITPNDKSLIVILDHIEDPHNLGAIIRTCEAANIDGIIIPKDRSATVNATVMKTSGGALTNIKIAMVTNLNQTLTKLKEKGYWIIGTSLQDSQDYKNIDYKTKVALIIGNEGKGISNSIEKSCDFLVKIPMYGKVNSLNASVATGIMVYEVINQQRK